MTPNQLRLILADALDGAADRLRAGIVPNEEPERTADDALAGDPLPNVTQHVLRADDVAQLLGLSRWKVYEAIRLGEIPSIRVGRRLLVPTHALRTWLSESGSGHLSSHEERLRDFRLEWPHAGDGQPSRNSGHPGPPLD